MADISTFIRHIKQAIYGEEVRGSICDGLEAINNDVENHYATIEAIEEIQNDIGDLSDAVENKADSNQIASTNQLGMVRFPSNSSGTNLSGITVNEMTGEVSINALARYGIILNNGIIGINAATQAEVHTGTELYKPITPKTLAQFINFYQAPARIGTWIDGTPIWRMAFKKRYDQEPTNKTIDPISNWINSTDNVQIILNGAAVMKVNNVACISNNVPMTMDKSRGTFSYSGDWTSFYGVEGFIEFVTPSDNVRYPDYPNNNS